jgi:DNA-binding response OmpR family regulator
LLDLDMPGMDGRTFYEQARAKGYRGPMLIFSAHGAAQAQHELGAQGFIEKPFDPDSLLQAVRSTLSNVEDSGAGRNIGDAPPNAASRWA